MAKTVSSATIGPLVLVPGYNPLTITTAGSATAPGIGVDAIDGAAGITWTIGNAGTVSAASGYGVFLAGEGVITNSGLITGIGASH